MTPWAHTHLPEEAFAWNSSRSSRTEDETLILATDAGERYALPSTRSCRPSMAPQSARQRGRGTHVQAEPARDPGAYPRRSITPTSRSAAELLGARLEDVARVSRAPSWQSASIVGQALAVPVLLARRPWSTRAFPRSARPSARSSPRSAPRASAGPAGRSRAAGSVKLEVLGPPTSTATPAGRLGPKRQHPLAHELRGDPALPPGIPAGKADLFVCVPWIRHPHSRTTPVSTVGRSGRGVCPSPRRIWRLGVRRTGGDRRAGRDQARTGELGHDGRNRGSPEALHAGAADSASRSPAPTVPVEPAHSPIALFDALEPGYDESPADDLEDTEVREPARAGGGDVGRRKGRATAVLGRDRLRRTHRRLITPVRRRAETDERDGPLLVGERAVLPDRALGSLSARRSS